MVTTSLGINQTAYDATPPNVVNARLDSGFERVSVDTIELPDTGTNDVAILTRVPVDAIITSVALATDDCGSAGTADLGFHKKNNDGTYTAVAAAALATGLDINSAAVAFTERRFSVLGIETIQQPAWQLAGLSARPAYDYLYISLTTTTGTTTIGTVSLKTKYTH